MFRPAARLLQLGQLRMEGTIRFIKAQEEDHADIGARLIAVRPPDLADLAIHLELSPPMIEINPAVHVITGAVTTDFDHGGTDQAQIAGLSSWGHKAD